MATRVRNIPTWEMTRVELARVFAEGFGYTGRAGGWIYSPEGHPVAQGWEAFAARLEQKGWIVVGKGIAWTVATWDGPLRPSSTYRATEVHAARMEAKGYERDRVMQLRKGRWTMVTAWVPKTGGR